MKNNTKIYKIINIIVILISFVFLGKIMFENGAVAISFFLKSNKVWSIIIVIIIFCLIHIIKLIRFYFILLEEKLELKRFVRIYIKTTFVNIVLPFKIGEVFRFYCYSNETNNYKIGFTRVERFLDTCALLLLILPFTIFVDKSILSVIYVFVIFVILGFIIYNMFYPMYNYINTFLILNTTSRKSLKILKVLEDANEWYIYMKKLIKGRFKLVFLLSLLAWIMEYLFVYILSTILGVKFLLETFNIYIISAFLGREDNLLQMYKLIGAATFGAIMLIAYAKSFKRGENNEK